MEDPPLKHPLGSVVFAKCQKFKPWPAEVKEVFLAPSASGLSEHIYNVKFIGNNSYSDHRISDLEPFNQRTYNKYKQIYTNSSNKEEQQILKSMTLAWKKHQQQKKRQRGRTTSRSPAAVVKESIPQRKTPKRNKSKSKAKAIISCQERRESRYSRRVRKGEALLEQSEKQEKQKRKQEMLSQEFKQQSKLIKKEEPIREKKIMSQNSKIKKRLREKKYRAQKRQNKLYDQSDEENKTQKGEQNTQEEKDNEKRGSSQRNPNKSNNKSKLKSLRGEDQGLPKTKTQQKSIEKERKDDYKWPHIAKDSQNEAPLKRDEYGVDSSVDELQIKDNDHNAFILLLPHRIVLLEEENPSFLVSLVNKHLQKMMDDLQGAPFKPTKPLSTKRRHSLMAIFKCQSVTVMTLLEGGTLSVMSDFIATFQTSRSLLKWRYEIEYDFIAGQAKLSCIKLKKLMAKLSWEEKKKQACQTMLDKLEVRLKS